jgi:hypothetical protein
MNAPHKVIKATFSDWRPVKGRKQLQLIFEVPLEETKEVLEMLGPPMPDRETWCAIARLDTDVAPPKLVDALGAAGFTLRESVTISGEMQKPRQNFCDLPFSQQAAMRSNDEKFAAWLGVTPGDDCAAAIRQECFVTSRSQIRKGTPAGNNWVALLRRYEYEEHH